MSRHNTTHALDYDRINHQLSELSSDAKSCLKRLCALDDKINRSVHGKKKCAQRSGSANFFAINTRSKALPPSELKPPCYP